MNPGIPQMVETTVPSLEGDKHVVDISITFELTPEERVKLHLDETVESQTRSYVVKLKPHEVDDPVKKTARILEGQARVLTNMARALYD